MKCKICGGEINHPLIENYYGNNPYPVRTGEDDRCCDMCNDVIVVPIRIRLVGTPREDVESIAEKLNDIKFTDLIEIARF